MFKEDITAFRNFKHIIADIHKKAPNVTKDQIRHTMYITLIDVRCGILNVRAPK